MTRGPTLRSVKSLSVGIVCLIDIVVFSLSTSYYTSGIFHNQHLDFFSAPSKMNICSKRHCPGIPDLSECFSVEVDGPSLLYELRFKPKSSDSEQRDVKVTLDGSESFQENLRLNHFESLRLASRLHSDCKKEDCHDFVKWLPLELVLRIFSYLRPECLMRASQVNRAWNRATHHPRLFQRLCCSPEWSLPNLDADFPPPLECRNANFFFPNLPSSTDTTTTTDVSSPSDGVDVRSVHCLAYDAYRIVSGSADSTICVWKVCSNANWLAQTLRGHSGAVRCLELLPLPPALASPTSPAVTPLSPSVWEPPEALLISGSVDTSLKLWRLSSTFEWSRITCIGTLQGHFDTVRCVQSSLPLASGLYYAHAVGIWTLRKFDGTTASSDLADSTKAISGSYDCTIRLWDLASSSQKAIFRGHTAGVVCLTYDDSLLYSGSLDNTVRIWSLKTAACYYTLVRPGTRPGAEFWTTPVTSLHLDVQRRRLFVSHHDGRICVWRIPHSPPALQPAMVDKLSSTTTLNWERPKLLEQLCVEAENAQSTGAVIRCLAGDGWHLLCGCDDQTIKVWRADTNTPIGCLRGHEDGVTCLLIYGSVVISGSYDKNVILYDFDVS
ncbi:F-box/WD repeat-containing protein [Echinococcus granulosus]|uniref:F-box/WD repeat-containing protein n=1 Tax=Echinococcus granulosus TaxID=6210 RepID=W6USF8_ECHGR|nr:F-box/WD repeat-containing protein [Echinococcus granulosus]EUB61302.1 F-box/WD repeat-containing protein [Echinococcus granulosus]